MSVPDDLPLSQPPQRPQGLGGCIVALLVVIGIVLLLPGLCSLIFVLAYQGEGAGSVGLLWLITFVIAALGIMLMRYAIKNR